MRTRLTNATNNASAAYPLNKKPSHKNIKCNPPEKGKKNQPKIQMPKNQNADLNTADIQVQFKNISLREEHQVLSQHINPSTNRKDELKEYLEQIFQYLGQLQTQYIIDYTCQKINKKTRLFLIKYLFKLSQKFYLRVKTFQLSILYLDRYLFSLSCPPAHQDLIAITQASMHIAMKMEQIYPPKLKEWTDKTHRVRILEKEAEILAHLDFKLNVLTPIQMVSYFCPGPVEANSRLQLLSNLVLVDMVNRKIQNFIYRECGKKFYQQMVSMTLKIKNGEVDRLQSERIQMNIRWMIERNSQTLSWIKDSY